MNAQPLTSRPSGPEPLRFDIVLVGGGLSAGLIALALAKYRPDVSVAIVEGGPAFGGNHTWSSFASDLTPEGAALAEPLIAHRWPEYQIRFPSFARHIPSGYQSAFSHRLHDALEAALPPHARFLGVPVVAVTADGITLANQQAIAGGAVIDARGQRDAPHLELGFQKFVGLEVELEEPHGLAGPIIMDATVDQLDGYRFVYTLPFTATTAMIEDTYFADGTVLDRAAVAARVHAYAASQGWRIRRILREEDGVLPMTISGDIRAHLATFPDGVIPVGMAAGLFHPATGYSFPDAVRLALHIARLPDLSGAAIDRAVRSFAASTWESRGFYHLLNKMLFRAAYPHERRGILAHFYRLDAGLVERFYAGHSTLVDKMRVLTGKPPIPIPRAIRGILKSPAAPAPVRAAAKAPAPGAAKKD